MAIRLFEGAAHAASYAAFRPSYPPTVLEAISGFIKTHSGSGLSSAVDVGCGSGQSTFFLTSLFDRVFGVDVSEAQIQNARAKQQQQQPQIDVTGGCKKEVEFRVASADRLPLETSSVDLVSCAQAWHWLEPAPFYREAARVLRPRGSIAVYGYGNVEVLCSSEAQRLVSEFYSGLRTGGYWHENRRHIDDKYREVQLSSPFAITERKDLEMSCRMSLSHFAGYVSTWSGYCSFMEKHPNSTILDELQERLKAALLAPGTGKEPHLDISFPVFIVMGLKT